MNHIAVREAAVFDIGSNPLVWLIIIIIGVGFLVWLAVWFLDHILQPYIAEPFFTWAHYAIYFLGIGYCILLALDTLFGIRLLNFSGGGRNG
jgi:hypothetical protein